MESRNELTTRVGLAKYSIIGYDDDLSSTENFTANEGKVGLSHRDVAKASDFFICTAVDSLQIDKIFFHEQTGVAKELPNGAVVLTCSTVSPDYHAALRERMDIAGREDVFILDCPVSGTKLAEGALRIFASGTPEALERSNALLEDMSEQVYHVPGGAGSASKVNMVNQLLIGIHIAVSGEAIALATKANLDIREVYDIISTGAAGDSRIFENRVPRMIKGDWTPHSTIDDFVQIMGMVTSTARSLQFPLPISSVVEQLYVLASSQGYGKEDDAAILRIFKPGIPYIAGGVTRGVQSESKPIKKGEPKSISKIGFIGLGAMGYGMATSLVRAGYSVTAYDVYLPSINKFIAAGKNDGGVTSAADAVAESDLVVLMVQSAAQAEDVLFGKGNVIDEVPNGATILLSCTVPSSFAKGLAAKLGALGRGINLVDAPVSGGAARAAKGELTFICSGDDAEIENLNEAFLAMAGTSSNICRVRGGVGAASSVKMINQLLAGVHIVAAAEAMAFASRLGLDLCIVLDILKNEGGWSWMLENRVPQILGRDWTPFSALEIFVKDMGIVTSEARRLRSFAPTSSVAYTLYLDGAAKGLSKEADIGVFRLWPLTAKTTETIH